MSKLKIALSICLMINLFFSSNRILGQSTNNNYPILIVYEGDTVVAITKSQVDSVNITYAILDEYTELTDSLKSIIHKYGMVITKDKEIIDTYRNKCKHYEIIISKKDTIIQNSKRREEAVKKKNKKLKLANRLIIAATVIIDGILTVLYL